MFAERLERFGEVSTEGASGFSQVCWLSEEIIGHSILCSPLVTGH